MHIKNGDKVTVEYEGTLDDGTVFDSSKKHGKPLEFEVGAKQIIPGFENAIMSMEKGEEKKIKLQPAEAYGDYNPQMVKKIPKDKMPGDIKVGAMLAIGLPNGAKIPARVTEVEEKEVTLDLNHPLTGKTLNFKIKVVDIS